MSKATDSNLAQEGENIDLSSESDDDTRVHSMLSVAKMVKALIVPEDNLHSIDAMSRTSTPGDAKQLDIQPDLIQF